MARKRGGLAGLWDRNKHVIKPVATLAAGALTGGAGGALVGGLMNGLDREGKGGIGFDVGRGAVGAATGYGMGKIGGALKSGVMSRMGGNAATELLANNPAGAAAIRGVPAATMGAGGGGLQQGVLSRLGSGAANFLRDGKNLAAIGNTAMGAANAMNQNAQLRMEREAIARRQRLEDEDRQRQQTLDPARASLFAEIMRRLQAQGVAA
jgi:hypothetical protein